LPEGVGDDRVAPSVQRILETLPETRRRARVEHRPLAGELEAVAARLPEVRVEVRADGVPAHPELEPRPCRGQQVGADLLVVEARERPRDVVQCYRGIVRPEDADVA